MTTIIDSGVRADLVAAHRATVEALGRPGARWRATERVAIGREVRRALAHADLPPWQAPSGIEGMLDENHPLPPAAVDAVWRITNHPGTLTREWFEGIVAGLASVEHYIELASIVAPLTCVDRFAAILDLDPIPLPEPEPGEATGADVDASVSTHWVPTVGDRGANVMRALTGVAGGVDLWLTLSPAQYVDHDALLGDLDWSRGTLDRRQIELLAAKTSLVNECFY